MAESRTAGRRVAHAVVVALAVFVVNFFGFGLIDFASGLIPSEDEWSLTNVGYGLLVTVYLSVALVATLRSGHVGRVARETVSIVLASLLVMFIFSTRYDRGFSGQEGGVIGFVNVAIIGIPSLGVLALQERQPRLPAARPPVWLAIALGLGVVAGLGVASVGCVLQLHENDPYEAARNGYGGYSAWGAFGLATAVLCLVILRRTHRLTLSCLAGAGIVYGGVGFLNPLDFGSLGVWGVVPIAWGLALGVAVLWPKPG